MGFCITLLHGIKKFMTIFGLLVLFKKGMYMDTPCSVHANVGVSECNVTV